MPDRAVAGPVGGGVAIGAEVAFLRSPDAYPGRPADIRIIETHMSWVFLAGPSVYKLKKPVRYSYLDLSSLSARSRNCSEEIRLNRRLAPGTYLEKIPLTQSPQGGFGLGGRGRVVDWLVKMRRLPAGRMLDRLIRERALKAGDLARLAVVLARFYARARPTAWTPGAYGRRLRQDIESNAAALLGPSYGLPAPQIRGILAAQRRFLECRRQAVEERVRAGRVVEGHGDLRPEHVCLERRPVIIDCLEFSRDMRTLDVADELGFLALECERLGDGEAGCRLLALYARLSGDAPPADLVAFYQSSRACLRAKLAAWHLDDNPSDREKWLARAREYLALGEKYAAASLPAVP